jgi:hypothetical protein
MCTCPHCRGHMADCGCHEDPVLQSGKKLLEILNEPEKPQERVLIRRTAPSRVKVEA